jgi:hypothetical protein
VTFCFFGILWNRRLLFGLEIFSLEGSAACLLVTRSDLECSEGEASWWGIAGKNAKMQEERLKHTEAQKKRHVHG